MAKKIHRRGNTEPTLGLEKDRDTPFADPANSKYRSTPRAGSRRRGPPATCQSATELWRISGELPPSRTMEMRWMTAERTSETAETSDSPDFERPPELPSALDITLAYHERTKHPASVPAALGYMDWDTQPDPFRRFDGAASAAGSCPGGPSRATSPRSLVTSPEPRSTVSRSPSSSRMRSRSPPGSRPAARVGRFGSTHRAAIFIRPKATWSPGPSRVFTHGPRSTTTRRSSMRSSSARSCRTKRG